MTKDVKHPIRAVIFDCDGTLLDTERIYMSTWYTTGKKYGYEIPKAMLEITRGESGETLRNIIFSYMGEEFPLELFRDERAIKNEEIFYQTSLDKLVKPGVLHLLDWLEKQEINFAVASARKYEVTSSHLKHVGILDRASVVLGRDLVENSKPAPDLFLKAADVMGVAPEECIVIGDTYLDYKAACAAGMRMFYVPDTVPANEEVLANAVVLKQVDEVIPIITNKNKII